MELEFKMQEWTYRTLPNKMYELVHNTGDLNKKGTGYLTDAESEMLTILNYLNFGEKTSITESMIAQIDQAIRASENDSLTKDDAMRAAKLNYKHMPALDFVEQMRDVAKTAVGLIFYHDEYATNKYTVEYYDIDKPVQVNVFDTIIDSRKYLEQEGCTIRMSSRAEDETLLETWI